MLSKPAANLTDSVFSYSIRHREQIITAFKFLYVLQIFVLIMGSVSAFNADNNYIIFYEISRKSADVAILLYIASVIPGICRRFGIKHKLVALLMIFRRYIGLAMFFSVLIHFFILRGAGYMKNGLPATVPLFQLFGSLALTFLIPMALTSNDFSVVKLKHWWNYIHKLTYIIIWFISLHLFFQGISVWSILLWTTLIIQLASFLYKFRGKKKEA